MRRHDRRDEHPHVLVIEDVRDDEGEVDWSVEHLDSCPTEEFLPFDDWLGKHEPMLYYTCLVEAILDSGLHEAIDATQKDPFPLKPGRYPIVGCSTYDDYTHESDIWIEPHPDPREWTAEEQAE